jgi:hypothetical protein
MNSPTTSLSALIKSIDIPNLPAPPIIEKQTGKKRKKESKSNPRRWSPSEDRDLRKAVASLGEKNWKSLSALVPGRNHTQCLQRWTKVLRPGLVKGHWTEAEDIILRQHVNAGNRNWGLIALEIVGRTSKQCRERWCNHLDPSINKGSYTKEEDELIISMQLNLGNRWSVIAHELTVSRLDPTEFYPRN